MMGHEGGLSDILPVEPKFTEDTSPLAHEIKTKVAQVRGSLLLDQPFFGYLLGQYTILPVVEKINKFAADSSFLYFNSQYIDDLIRNNTNWKGKLKLILIHLVVHLIYRHHIRSEDRVPKLWGAATDLVIQQALLNISEEWMAPLDWEVPPLRQVPDELLNHNAEKTYDLLLEMLVDEMEDDPSVVPKAADEEEPPPAQQMSENRAELMQYVEVKDELGNLIAEWCDIDEVVQASALDQDETEIEEQLFEGMLRSAYSFSRHHGSIPGDIERHVQNLIHPSVNWRAKLSQYLQRSIILDSSWSRPNKRLFGQGYYLPSKLKENITVGIALDTSGSVGEQKLQFFLTEAQQILQSHANTRLVVFDCDSVIQQVSIYEPGENLAGHTMIGGGGTDFRPVFEALPKYNLDVLLYLTDGYGRYPAAEPSMPVIWVLTSEKEPPFGERVRFTLNT